MLTATQVWDEIDGYVEQVPTAVLTEDNLVTMLAQMFEIEELDPDMPKQPHVVDEYGNLRRHVRSRLEQGGRL